MELQTMPLKFRVWNKEEKELVYDAELAYDYLYPDHNHLCVHNFYELIQDDRYIISQDTGLIDCVGNELYTGDLVEDANGVGVIEYEAPILQMRYNYKHTSRYITGKKIGNIWQTPELLEGE